jgi:hypothetical protein
MDLRLPCRMHPIVVSTLDVVGRWRARLRVSVNEFASVCFDDNGNRNHMRSHATRRNCQISAIEETHLVPSSFTTSTENW